MPDETNFREIIYNFLKSKEENLIFASANEIPFIIDYFDLDKFNPNLAENLLENPEEILDLFNEVIKEFDLDIEIQFKNLPKTQNIRIRNLRTKHLNKFITVEGIVKIASEVKPRIYETIYECQECGENFSQEQRGSTLIKPFACPKCGKRTGFKLLDKKMYDSRWITIQEPFEITSGEKPGEIKVFLKKDLTTPEMQRKTDPGNRIFVNGILKELPRKIRGKESTQSDIYIEANYVELAEEDIEDIKISKEDEKEILELSKDPKLYDKLVNSLAPSIYGNKEIKEAILLQLFGGTPLELPDGTNIRGNIHILLVGDPATAKSQLLKLTSKLIPRSKYVSGKGVTGAGLISTVRKDEFTGGWVLEAGALVLCNKGLIAIDEFEKMNKEDQVAMHEALEQGCYDYNTNIILSSGIITKIGDFVEDNLKDADNNKDRLCRDISRNNYYILSTNFKEIRPCKIIEVGKHIENELYEIELVTGQSLRVTKQHPIFVIRDGKIRLVKAHELKKEDYLPTPSYIPIKGKSYRFNFIPFKNKKIKEIKIPKKTSKEFCEWLGLIISEGNAKVNRKIKNGICFTNSDKEILSRYKYLLSNLFDIKPYLQKKDGRTMVRAISKSLYEFVNSIGEKILTKPYEKELPNWVFELPNVEIAYLLRGLFDGEGSVNYNYGTITFSSTSKKLAEQVQFLCLRLGIFSGLYIDKSKKGKRISYKLQISGKENIKKFAEKIGFTGKKRDKLNKLLTKNTISCKCNHIPNVMKKIEFIKKTLRLSDKECANYILTDVRKRDFISKDLLAKILKKFEYRLKQIEKLNKKLFIVKNYNEFRKIREQLRISRSEVARRIGLSEQNLWYWKVIKKDQKLLEKSIKEVSKICEEILSSVNPLIIDIKTILDSPVEWISIKSIKKIRGKFWVYDVTVNPTKTFIGNGIVCHNSVSIAKASIVATLPAQTSVLAGANPKLGRFDIYTPIADQITVPPTLLSRFDLKFALRDIPNPEEDEKLVDHVLGARKDIKTIEPEIKHSLLRKYIAYAKQNIKQVALSDSCLKELKKFFIDLRSRYSEEDRVMPITFRQFEGLIRLAQASAKLNLRKEATKEDAKRAIDIMQQSLKQLGFDVEAGKLDIDRVESSIAGTQRSKIRILLDIIDTLEKELKEVPIEDLGARAEEEGIEDWQDLIQKMKREGLLYEPKSGYIKKV
jgi:replicative DNA helicase Mcm